MVIFMNLKNRLFQWLKFLIIIFFLSAFSAISVLADSYRFSIPDDEATIWIDEDGSVYISYAMTINNSGKPLDYIDIGLPNDDYKLSNVTAEINGKEVLSEKISKADKDESGLDHGVTIDITDSPIPTGESISFTISVAGISQVLNKTSDVADVKEDYVSFNFMPNYFSSDFVEGNTILDVYLVLPKSVKDDDGRYFTPSDNWPGSQDPVDKYRTKDGNIVYEWKSSNASSSEKYEFGAAFPKSVLSSDTNIHTFNFWNSLKEYASCLIFLVVGALIFLWLKIPSKEEKRRKSSYLPPEINNDGNGIKRGLTAVEAAVLLEEDLDKVIMMIVFSLTKKGIMTVTSEKPFTADFNLSNTDELNQYETDFIEAVKEKDTVKRTALMKSLFQRLILSVKVKMAGFDKTQTQNYYKSIIAKAWEQVKEAQTPEMKGQLLDKNLGWAMLEGNLEKRTTESFGNDPVYLPDWWYNMGPGWHTYSSPHPSSGSYRPIPGNIPSESGKLNMPKLPGADFAHQISSSLQSFGQETVGDIKTFTGSVRSTTNPVKTTSSGSDNHNNHSHGGSCACACACAGCDCACAGGGR